MVCMAHVEPREVRWLWDQRIPAGRISLIVGIPGCGKSFVTCDMASRVSTGTPWPDGSPCERGSVMFITAEDDPADTIRPRLDAHGADVSRVHLLAGAIECDRDGRERDVCFTLADVLVLEQALAQVSDCKLIVIDPIGSFLGGRTDAHRDNEVRSVLAPVARLAEQCGAAVVVVAHRRKGSSGSADDTAMGSRAFTGLARAVWHLGKDAEDHRRRLLLPGKNNLAAEPDGLAFRIAGQPAAVQWERDPVAMTADDAMARERAAESGDKSAGVEAADWLRDTLEGGPRLASETKSLAKRDGIATRTLERASVALGVVKGPSQFGGPWMWQLPDCSLSLANLGQSRLTTESGETDETWRDCGRRCDCGANMVRSAMVVGGWRNWDCPSCGAIVPTLEGGQ
jgi:putative DNA primase/helicase